MRNPKQFLLFLVWILPCPTIGNAIIPKKNKSFDANSCAKILNGALTKKNHRPIMLDNEDEEDLSDQCDWASMFRLNAPFIFLEGNVIRVDQVYGSDARGTRNGIPFATINGALNAAFSGDAVRIFPGTYNESFTIPSGVSVVGISTEAVQINKSVSVATDLVTMGENSRLENVALTLTSSSHVQLRGIVFPGTSTATSKVRTATLTVDNSAAGTGGTSNVYGIHSTGTGQPGEQTSAIRASTITVNSAGAGAKRGLLNDSASDIHIRDTNVFITNNGTGSAIGVETNNAGAAFTARNSTISGTNTGTPVAAADISQTLGTMTIVATDLLNANANGFSFTPAVAPSNISWAYLGITPIGTNFMHVGTASPSATITSVRCNQALLVIALSVQASATPLAGPPDTWTVLKNGIATGMSVTLTNPALSNVNNTQSVSFAAGDTIALQVSKGSGNNTQGSANAIVDMILY